MNKSLPRTIYAVPATWCMEAYKAVSESNTGSRIFNIPFEAFCKETDMALGVAKASSLWTYEPTIDGGEQDRTMFFLSEMSRLLTSHHDDRKDTFAEKILEDRSLVGTSWAVIEQAVNRTGNEHKSTIFQKTFEKAQEQQRLFKANVSAQMAVLRQRFDALGGRVVTSELAGYSTFSLLRDDLDEMEAKVTAVLDGGIAAFSDGTTAVAAESQAEGGISQPDCVRGTVFENVTTLAEFEETLDKLCNREILLDGSDPADWVHPPSDVAEGIRGWPAEGDTARGTTLQFGDMPPVPYTSHR